MTQGADETPPSIEAAARIAPPSRADQMWLMSALMLCLFLAALDQTIIAPALPTIGRSLGDFQNLSWTITAFFLTYTAVAPVFGRLSDIFGRRTMIYWALGLFLAGSIACALADNMLMLILARAFQGLGGGGLIPVAQTVVSDFVPPRERGRYQTWFSATWTAAGLGGPLLGGILAEKLHWSMIFWINVPFCLIAFVLVSWKFGKLPQVHVPRRVDLVGAVMMLAASVIFVLAITWGGVHFPWLSYEIFGLLALTLLIVAAFVFHVSRTAEPFLPLHILSGPVVLQAIVGSGCVMGTVIGLSIVLPVHFQMVYHLSPSLAGLALLPLATLSVAGALLSGRAMSYMRNYKLISIVFLSLSAVVAFVMYLYPQLPLWLILVFTAIISFGQGTQFPLSTVVVQNAVARHDVGTVTGAIAFFRGLGGAIGAALFTSILLAQIGSHADGSHGTDLLATFADAGPVAAAEALRYVYLASAVVLVVSIVAYITMEARPLAGAQHAPSAAE